MTPSSSSSSSAYAFKPGGSLKFKGGDPPGLKKKKKKSRSSTSDSVHKGHRTSTNSDNDTTALIYKDRDINGDIPNDSIRENEDEDGDEMEERSTSGPKMTEAERRFEKIRKQRLEERVAKQAKLSHKDRVDAFNRDLESRTEHFEMKRVGGGG